MTKILSMGLWRLSFPGSWVILFQSFHSFFSFLSTFSVLLHSHCHNFSLAYILFCTLLSSSYIIYIPTFFLFVSFLVTLLFTYLITFLINFSFCFVLNISPFSFFISVHLILHLFISRLDFSIILHGTISQNRQHLLIHSHYLAVTCPKTQQKSVDFMTIFNVQILYNANIQFNFCELKIIYLMF